MARLRTAPGKQMTRICPNPVPWDKTFKKLLLYAHSHPCAPAKPPVPLILSGWAFSSDAQKKQRWEETVMWAVQNGCPRLVDIPDTNFYCVDDMTS